MKITVNTWAGIRHPMIEMKRSSPLTALVVPALLAALLAGGCQQTASSGAAISPGGVDPAPLLAKIPEDLRVKVEPEDPAAQQRYIDASRLVKADASARQAYYSGGSQMPCTQETLVALRKILKSGPIEIGYDEALDDPNNPYMNQGGGSVGSVLGSAGLAEIRAGKRVEGVDDLVLQIKWSNQTTDFTSDFMGMQFESTRHIQEAFQQANLTPAEMKRILAAYPSEPELVEMQRNQIRFGLEDRVIALAAMQAPRKDMVITKMGTTYQSYSPVVSRSGRTALVVPPHGTLDREQTLKDLIALAEYTMKRAEVDMGPNYGGQPPALTEIVKWVPRMPGPLKTNTAKEREAMKKKIDLYVAEMNKGENTLGRQFLSGGFQMGMGGIQQLRQTISSLKQMIDRPAPISSVPLRHR